MNLISGLTWDDFQGPNPTQTMRHVCTICFSFDKEAKRMNSKTIGMVEKRRERTMFQRWSVQDWMSGLV